jgi:hypothetical protein
MFIYVINNETKNKRFVGLAINTTNPVAYHKDRKVVDALHSDLKAGDVCTWTKLAAPATLTMCEKMLDKFIVSLNPEYNV